MIKILKEGVIPKPKKYIYKIKCFFCECEFEFELEDCLDVERCPNGHVTVECPCCHKHIAKRRGELESREIEEKIANKIKDLTLEEFHLLKEVLE